MTDDPRVRAEVLARLDELLVRLEEVLREIQRMLGPTAPALATVSAQRLREIVREELEAALGPASSRERLRLVAQVGDGAGTD